MKILSLWQPWASLWVGGAKTIETRSWGTSYRGPIAVHASKKWNIDLQHLARTELFRSALLALGFEGTGQLPLGAILGTVELTDCLRMIAGDGSPRRLSLALDGDPRLTPQERAFGNYAPGRYAWVTGPSRFILAEPLPFRGAQGLRDLDEDTVRSVRTLAANRPVDARATRQPTTERTR